MGQAIIGQEAVIERLIIGLLANGNLLVEGLPGLAKTRAIKVLARNLEAAFSRVQFTPDLLPSDVSRLLAAHELNWFNLGKDQVAAAELESFEIISDGPPPTTRSAPFDSRAATPWIIAATLQVTVAGLSVLRLWPRLAALRRRRREDYLASEVLAFTQVLAALRARNLDETLRAVDLWCRRLPSGSKGPDMRLSRALAGLGAAYYRVGSRAPSPQVWSETDQALRAQRRTCLSATARAVGNLPPLNPRRS